MRQARASGLLPGTIAIAQTSLRHLGIVFAAREPGPELQHLSKLEMHGVRNGDARRLLGSAVRFKLDERVRDRIIAETRGNPLALLECREG